MTGLRKRSQIAAVVAVSMIIFISSPALAQSPAWESDRTSYRMIGDFFVIRPLGIIGTAFGSVMFVLTLPFSAVGGNVDEAAQKLVVEPAKFTFTRPLGELPESEQWD